jgi:hypothetical protein
LIDPWLANDLKLGSTDVNCFLQAVDPADLAGFLRSPASTWPGILQLLEAAAWKKNGCWASFLGVVNHHIVIVIAVTLW